MSSYWNKINLENIDTPALLVDKDMVEYNIQQAIVYAQGVDHFRPHVKTHKTLEVAKMQMAAGIYKFKCATIAEAEMLALAKAKDVLIAYSLQGPKIRRYVELVSKYPETQFSSLVDNQENIQELNDVFSSRSKLAEVFIDINNGNNRSGIGTKEAKLVARKISEMSNLKLRGIHCYDGHIRMSSLDDRIKKVMKAFNQVEKFHEHLELETGLKMTIVAGGSPSFSVHSRFHDVESSPGTWIFWDQRYGQDYKELAFNKAAVVATRVISQIDKHHYCLDLGHKSIASEMPLPRMKFTDDIKASQVSQSEEHLVIKCKQKNALEVGQTLTVYPYHICPTVAEYSEINVVQDGVVIDQWEVTARNRKITV